MIKDFIKQNDFVKEYSLENYSDYEQVIRNKVGYIKVNLDFDTNLIKLFSSSLFKPFNSMLGILLFCKSFITFSNNKNE